MISKLTMADAGFAARSRTRTSWPTDRPGPWDRCLHRRVPQHHHAAAPLGIDLDQGAGEDLADPAGQHVRLDPVQHGILVAVGRLRGRGQLCRQLRVGLHRPTGAPPFRRTGPRRPHRRTGRPVVAGAR